MKRYYFLIFFFALLMMGNVDAATFPVSNQTEFQAALTAAQTNGQDDIINVSAGTMILTAALSYFPAVTENYTLTIQGAGSGLTILDGNFLFCPMVLNTTGVTTPDDDNAHLAVSGITFRNGYSNA